MSKTFRTVGVGSTQTLEKIENNKIPIYETKAAAEADIANLTDGQLIATKDEGNENAKPVDVVEKGNLHAATSNAVADSLSYSTQEVKTGGTWIDGKPIYRNVLIAKEILNGEEIGWAGLESDVASLNIDSCLRCFAITVGDGSRHLQFMPNKGGFSSYKSGINAGSKIILEYTKTTD